MIEPNPFILQYIRKQSCWIFFGTSVNPFLYFLPAVDFPYAVLLIYLENQCRGSIAEGIDIGCESVFGYHLWCRFSILIFDFVVICAYWKAGGCMKGYLFQCISVESQLFSRGCIWCECNGRKFWAVVVPYDAAKRSEIHNVFLINISQDIPHFGQRSPGRISACNPCPFSRISVVSEKGIVCAKAVPPVRARPTKKAANPDKSFFFNDCMLYSPSSWAKTKTKYFLWKV